jgi:hypothetical protein
MTKWGNLTIWGKTLYIATHQLGYDNWEITTL